MNFFEAQDKARRTSRRLVLVYIVAVIAIVVGVTAIVGFALSQFSGTTGGLTAGAGNRSILVATAIATTLIILISSLYKTARLSSGGGRVAMDMGGTLVPGDVQDPLRRRLRNVVEEMAIASGVTVPEIYVLEEEESINAFAAGFSPSDAAIAVTRGTLRLLNRDELQGVIAHEFSHILNGDMRLNIRLMGVLFGIMSLGLIGRVALRGSYHASLVSGRRGRSHPAVLAIGIGFLLLGTIGVFFGRMIKASVSRQREYLADASAVQFTRQSEGIAGALKKIGGYSNGSKLSAADPEEISHMLFGNGSGFSGLFATHPPLVQRIQAIDPSFREADFEPVDFSNWQESIEPEAGPAAFTGSTGRVAAVDSMPVTGDAIAAAVGQPENDHVEFAGALRRSIPEELYEAAHSTEFAYLLAVALVLDHTDRASSRQLSIVREQLGEQRAQIVRRHHEQLLAAGIEYRLPLLEIAFPALKLRPRAELTYLIELVDRLIHVDGAIALFEFCFFQVLKNSLARAIDPAVRHDVRRVPRNKLRSAALEVLRTLSDHGHDNDGDRRDAFKAGVDKFGAWAREQENSPDASRDLNMMSQSLDTLAGLNSAGRTALMSAIVATATHDGRISIEEAELVRVVSASLDYPLPPIFMHQ